MKLPRLLRFSSHFLWLLFLASVSSTKAQVPPVRQVVELYTKRNETSYGKLEGHGRLYFQAVVFDDYFLADWYDTLVYYPRGSSEGLQLRRNLRAINVFLVAEVRRPGTVRTFLKEHLWRFLADNFGDGEIAVGDANVITPTDVAEGLDTFIVEADQRSATRRERARAKLRSYARSEKPVVEGNIWTVDVHVVTNDGAVEHWLVKGRVMPLQIDSFLCEPKEPRGSFQTVPVSH